VLFNSFWKTLLIFILIESSLDSWILSLDSWILNLDLDSWNLLDSWFFGIIKIILEGIASTRGREGAQNFMPQMRSELWSVILEWSKFKKCRHMASIYSLSVTQNWREIEFLFKFHLNLKLNLWSQNFTNYD